MADSNEIRKDKEFIEKNYDRLPNGQLRFKKGCQIGNMPKKGYTLLDLTKVAMEYDKTHDVSLLKHYVEQLLVDNRLLENFINKYVPTKTISELTGPGGEPLTFIIEKSYEKDKSQADT